MGRWLVPPESYEFYNDFYERVANLNYDIAVKGHLGFFGSPETVRDEKRGVSIGT